MAHHSLKKKEKVALLHPGSLEVALAKTVDGIWGSPPTERLGVYHHSTNSTQNTQVLKKQKPGSGFKLWLRFCSHYDKIFGFQIITTVLKLLHWAGWKFRNWLMKIHTCFGVRWNPGVLPLKKCFWQISQTRFLYAKNWSLSTTIIFQFWV